jgi:hypothetical protein
MEDPFVTYEAIQAIRYYQVIQSQYVPFLFLRLSPRSRFSFSKNSDHQVPESHNNVGGAIYAGRHQ